MGPFPSAIKIAVAAAVGFSVYALVLRAMFPAAWSDLELLARRVVLRRPRASDVGQQLGQEG
jgi:hypothetical protein